MAKKIMEKNTKEYNYRRSTFYFKGKQYSATGKTQREADKKAALKLDRLERGEIGISERMTVRAWSKEWMVTYKMPILTEKSYSDYQSTLDNIILPQIGGLQLDEVKDIHLQKILNSKAGYSLSRMRKLKNRITAMFEQARASKLLLYNPAEFITMPKAIDGTHRSITDFERQHFLLSCENHHAGLMFKTMLYCGLRTGEVVALDWRDIDFDKRRIKVSRALESGSRNIKETKTAAGVREVPIPDEIFSDFVKQKGDPFAPVFLQERGKVRHTHSSRRKAWDSLKKQIDISMGAKFEKKEAKDGKKRLTKVLSVVAPDFVPYCPRHTYCTDLQTKGVPINIAKYLMGHTDISVTASIYTHMSEESIEDAAKLINNAKNNANKKSSSRKHALQ